MEVFLSPHPDDAVWSCGGRMAALVAAGRPVVVVTCFSGDPGGDWGWLGEPWRAIARPRLRRIEDDRAIARIGGRLLTLGLPDAALRGDDAGPAYRTPLDLQAGEPEAGVVAALVDRLDGILRPGCRLHAPLAMGGHADHRAVADAVRLLPGPCEVIWYEDFPYPFHPPADLEARLEPACDSEAWLAAALLYRSQVIALFGNAAEARRRLAAHASRAGDGQGDRVWVASAAK